MTKLLTALVVGGIAFAVASADTEKPTAKKAAGKLPQPIVDTHEFMEIFNEDLYENLKAKMAKEPADARAWKMLSRSGYRVAEVANLLAIRERSEEHDKLWNDLSADLQNTGIQLAEAAKKKDWAASQAAYKAIIKNCNDCHQKTEPEHAPEIEP